MRLFRLQSLPLATVAFALAGGLSLGTGFLSGTPSLARAVAAIPPGGVLSGQARVVDGDTIDIRGTRIRLEGIDAPEAGQTCTSSKGAPWDCGNAATRALVALIAGRDIDCHERGLDKYGRLLAICFAGAADLNGEMVRQGYAWAFVKYSRSYVAEEASARAALAGVWQGPAMPPWEYRRQNWSTAASGAPEGCAIKGNISRGGLIYHMPWSPWYHQVQMSDAKGTRWFCSESEAQAAGWRPALTR
jgi:endonuclease YncB( thermonuclease family)